MIVQSPRPAGTIARLSAQALRLVAATLAATAAVAGVWVWQSWGGTFTVHLVGDVASLAGVAFAAACAGWAAHSARGRTRRGWQAMTAGLLAWAVGALIWSYHETWLAIDKIPFPSIADAAFLLFPVGAVATLLWLSGGSTRYRVRLILDAVIIATSLFIVAWVVVLRQVFRLGEESQLTTTLSLTYLAVDAFTVAMAVLVFAGARPPRRVSVGLLAGGIVLLAVADMATIYLNALGDDHTDHVIDIVLFGAFGLMGLAALSSVGEPEPQSQPMPLPSGTRVWLPFVPLVLGIVAWFWQVLPDIGVLLLLSALVLIVATLTRQFVQLVENQRLLSDVGRLVFRDQLTGLANRARFLDKVGQVVVRQRREPTPLGVLCLDLDNFKTVNDAMGHPAGDELLVRIARRLTACVGTTHTVARLGGDEFAVLIEGSVEESLHVADCVLGAFDRPIVVDGVALTVRPSIGLTLATEPGSPASVDDLLRQADLAMYAAKRSGGGCVRSFVPGLPNPYELPERSAAPTEPTGSDATGPTVPVALVSNPEQRADDDETAMAPVSTRWPPTVIRFALGALLIGVVAFAISTLVRTHPGRIVPLDSWLYDMLMLSAAALVLVRAWLVPNERRPWLLIGAGMATSAMGDVVYALWVPEGASPSLADPLYLAFYPLCYAGLLVLMRLRLRRVPSAIRLDAVVVGFTVAAVAAALVSGPIDPAAKRSPETVVVGLAYAAGDLLLLALAAGALAILGLRTGQRWGLLVAGFMVFAVADGYYLFRTTSGAYLEGTWVDACWPTAYALIAIASWLPWLNATPRTKSGLASLVTPVVCAAVALAVSVLAYDNRLPVVLAALSLTAVAGRFAVTFRDVSALAEHHQNAMTDELTGLANRRALATALTAAHFDGPEWTWDRAQSRLALLLLDVDQFKEINDSLGRGVGDELLRRIAERLSTTLRPGDLLARTGGDEFAVLLSDDVDLTVARAQAGCMLEALRVPFALDYITVQVDARLAITLFPEHCVRPDELLGRAEAMLAHPGVGERQIAVYDAAADLPADDAVQLVADLRRALDTESDAPDCGVLTCHYQPKISAADEQVHSVEALVRWQHPTRGLLLPAQFLPAAEQAGLMRLVTARVLDIALGEIRSLRDRGIELTVAVNLSTTNLLDLGLVDTIDGLLQEHQLPAAALILEITESTLTTDSQRARKTVAALRQLGIRLSLDDYGTGWSSLARLQDLSVDELKLDKVFVARLARDPRSIVIVRSTVALARSLGADLVAEGVEDVDTLNALRLYGCNITQGHVHSPPLAADLLHRWLTTRSHDPRFGVGAGVG